MPETVPPTIPADPHTPPLPVGLVSDPSDTPPLRIGLVGCGTVGHLHRVRLSDEPVEIVAICDPDADSLSHMAETLPRRPRLFRSEQDLLAANMVDAVILCTPHALHSAQSRAALEANVHVLCEKPFVINTDEAKELIALARAKNRALWVSYTRRSRGHARFLMEAGKRIAPLQNIVITRAQPWLQRHERTWRVRASEGGGFLLDAGASLLDMVSQLVTAEVIDLNARLYRRGVAEVDTRAQVQIAFADDTLAMLTLIGDATEEIESIRLFGENGTAGWFLREDTPHDLYIRTADGILENVDPPPYRLPLPDSAFVAAIRNGHDFSSDTDAGMHDAQTALPVIALLERIYRDFGDG